MFKLKSANYLLRSDVTSLRETNQHLLEHNVSLEASHSALKQNVTKMSQSNMRLAVNNAEQKDAIVKLKQELKMEKIRNNSERKSLQDQLQDKDKHHDMEMNEIRRELERLRKIIAKTPKNKDPKDERAKFDRSASGVPRVASVGNMSVASTLASSDDEWGHDAYFEKNKASRKGKKRERRPRKPRGSAGGGSGRRYSGDGPRKSGNRGNSRSSNYKKGLVPNKYSSPTNKPMPNSSLAAAATKSATPTPSPGNSRPNSRPTSRATSPIPSGGGGRGGDSRRSMGSSKGSNKSSSSFKSPPSGGSNAPERTMSQSSLGSSGKGKQRSDFHRGKSQGQMHKNKK